MKVLISAIACNPYLGSENYFGWSAVTALARDHDLWVLTDRRNESDLQRAGAEGLIPANVRFILVGEFRPWHANRMLARMQSWQEYIRFTKNSLKVAQELHQAEKFDLVQHLTYSTARVASPLWRLGIPFILGPIVGNEPFPFRIFRVLSPAGAAFELVRKTSNVTFHFSPGVRRSICQADHVFAITPVAEQLMRRMRGSGEGISQLSSGFYSAAKVAEFSRFVPAKNVNGVLRLYAAGNLGGQKCIALAFRALARAKQKGVNFRYLLGSNGPEIPHLKKLAVKLNLSDEIIFGDSMSREKYQQELGNTHVYLLPSMRETVGLTMMEAMLAGCVPIVADDGGPKATVTDECGYKIPVTTPDRMAEAIASIIVTIDGNRKIISEKGSLASKRIATYYTEEYYRQTTMAVYLSLVKRNGAVT